MIEMVDLTSSSGLTIVLDHRNRQLRFGDQLVVQTIKKREVSEMRDVLLESPDIPDDTDLYVMYDGVHRKCDKNLVSSKRLRYDLTLIHPGKLGREFIKTAGHYHSICQDGELSYPELYEVLHGEVHFILQKADKTEGEIADVLLIRAGRGERIMIPPNYGHVAVNCVSEPLVLANWIAEDCRNDYKAIARYGGAALFEIEEGGKAKLIQNESYKYVPPLREIKIDSLSFFQFEDAPSLYELLLKDLRALECLRYPRMAIKEFQDYTGRKLGPQK